MKILNVLAAVMLPLALSAQPRGIRLEECLESAESNDMTARNSHLDVLSAKEVRSEALWGYFPNVGIVSWGYGAINPLVKITSHDVLGNSDAANNLNEQIKAYTYENGIKPYYETAKYGYGIGVGAVQPVYMGGVIVNGNRLAELGVQASQIKERINLRDMRDTVESKYWRIVALQEKEITLKDASKLLDEVEKDVLSASGAGLATESDLLNVRLRKKELEAGMLKLRNGLKLLKMDLFNTVGLPYSYLSLKDMELTDRLDTLSSPQEIMSGEDAASALDESRLLALNVESARLKKKLEMGKLKPQVAIGANYGYNDLLGQNRPQFNGIAYATVRIPLSALGKIGIASRKMDYQIEKARNEQEFLDKQLDLKFDMSRLELESAWEQLGVSRESVIVAEDALKHIRSNFEAGLATSSEFLRAEYSLRTEKEKMIDYMIEYRNAVSIYKSLRGEE